MKTAWVNLKLKKCSKAKATIKRLIKINGLINIKQPFKNEPDEDLANLYIAEVDLDKIDNIIAKMIDDDAVQYAERAPKRRLIKKQKPK